MHKEHIGLKRFVAFITPLLMWLLLLFELDFVISKVYGDYDPNWGVLAINTNKSYYSPGEEAHFEFAVLDSKGMMVCDADLKLDIVDEGGIVIDTLKTSDGSIIVNPDCHSKVNYEKPDFEASYSFGSTGDYNLTLTAGTRYGEHTSGRQVIVTNNIPFEVERKSYTRIFPVNTHRVDIFITPTENFKGVVEELVPAELSILESTLFKAVTPDEDRQKISWQVDWTAGDSYELSYYFDSPNKSPEFYTIGPLQIRKDQNIFQKVLKLDDIKYKDLGAWQIASDDILNRYSTVCTASGPKTWAPDTNSAGLPDLGSTASLSSFDTTNSATATIGDEPNMQCDTFDSRDLGSINSVNVVFSFATAGANNGDDYLDVNYAVGASVYDLVNIVQDATEKSNNTNGGYWSYAAANITNWVDVGNTAVHFDGIKTLRSDKDGAFIDAVWLEIDYTPRTYTQNDFEWYVTENSVTLTNIWPGGGGDNLLENEVFTQFPATNEALSYTDQVRIQMNFTVGNANLLTTTESFKLQFSGSDDCTTATGWTDVGAKASGTIWRFFDEAAIGDSTAQVNQISTSDSGAEGYYSEVNSTANNPNAVNTTQNTEWDWPVEHNGAADNTTYCFRMILFDGTDFDTYNSDGYPKLTTAPGGSNMMRHGKVFQNDVERGHFWAD